jgi:hypothetical protein
LGASLLTNKNNINVFQWVITKIRPALATIFDSIILCPKIVKSGVNIMCTYDVDVVKVKVLDNYRLYVQFADGKAGELDIAKLVPFVGIFASLKDKKFFNAVTVNSDIGTICWANGADLAPSYLYENLV